MGKIVLITILSVFSLIAKGQEFVKQNLLKATATISPSFGGQDERFYIHGHLEYFPEEKVSIRGDGYLDLHYTKEQKLANNIKRSHSVFFGAMYHLNKEKTFDPFIGFQPGVAFSTPVTYNQLEGDINRKLTISPLLSFRLGLNYFVGDYFNFFIENQYVTGKSTGFDSFYYSLNEFRISAGLGFNLSFKSIKD